MKVKVCFDKGTIVFCCGGLGAGGRGGLRRIVPGLRRVFAGRTGVVVTWAPFMSSGAVSEATFC